MQHCFRTVMPTNLSKWWWNAGSQSESTTFQSSPCSLLHSFSKYLPSSLLQEALCPRCDRLPPRLSWTCWSSQWFRFPGFLPINAFPRDTKETGLSNTLHRQQFAFAARTASGNHRRGWEVSKVALTSVLLPMTQLQQHTPKWAHRMGFGRKL